MNYYFKDTRTFELPKASVKIKNFKKTVGSGYFFDFKEFLHYFTKDTAFCYQFGDDTHINPYPTLFKARPISDNNQNSILFKLNKNRHFKWVDDPTPFAEKLNQMVWRGGAYLEPRRSFVPKVYDHPRCNIGQTNKPKEDVPWQKDFLSREEQLKYKFILSIEGNDVATNLKWILSSNSLCVMPKPKFETWFMEGKLQAGVHYVELNSDYSNIDETIDYYAEHTDEAQKIITNANAYAQQFMNQDLEDLLCLKILEKYAELSGQNTAPRFR